MCLERLVPEAPRLRQDLVDLSPLPRRPAVDWVRTLQDMIVAAEKQRRFAANVGPNCHVLDLDAGHMCMVGRPERPRRSSTRSAKYSERRQRTGDRRLQRENERLRAVATVALRLERDVELVQRARGRGAASCSRAASSSAIAMSFTKWSTKNPGA